MYVRFYRYLYMPISIYIYIYIYINIVSHFSTAPLHEKYNPKEVAPVQGPGGASARAKAC